MNHALSNWSSRLYQEAVELLHDSTLLWGAAFQVAFIAAALVGFAISGPRLRRALTTRAQRLPPGPAFQIIFAFVRIAPWTLFLLALWFGVLVAREMEQRTDLLRLAESLSLAWIV